MGQPLAILSNCKMWFMSIHMLQKHALFWLPLIWMHFSVHVVKFNCYKMVSQSRDIDKTET